MRLLQISCALLAMLFAFALMMATLVALGTWARGAMHRARPGVLRASHLGGLMLASLFTGFRKIVHPHVRHAIVQEIDEQDGSGNDHIPHGERCYREQLRRIRRGEDIEDLELVQDAPP